MNLDDIKKTFKTEALELLSSIEQVAMEMERNPKNQDCLGQAFRVMHTIKGSGAMYGFDEVAALAHDLEAVLDKVRRGELVVCAEIIDIILEAKDVLQKMVETPESSFDSGRLKSKLDMFLDRDPEVQDRSVSTAANAKPNQDNGELRQYRIFFRPAPDIYKRGILPDILLRELAELGDVLTLAVTDNIPEIDQMESDTCFLAWDILLSTTKSVDEIRDVFIFAEDGAELRIEPQIKEQNNKQTSLSNQSPEQPTIHEAKQHDASAVRYVNNKENVRVSSDKLDGLIDLVGELVTAQEMLKQIVSGWEEYTITDNHEEFVQHLRENNFSSISSLISIAEQFTRLTTDIRERSMSIRMVPVGTVFMKYSRLVRDLSRQLGKNVNLVVEGGDTELDKNIIEKLSDALVHIIRNAVDHGIESPHDRELAGKAGQGTILLKAEYTGKNVTIRISDDGRGIDVERLVRRAEESGAFPNAARLPDNEKLNLIFAPGLSTSSAVTDISGRGVGMDVVKKSIDSMRGTTSIMNLPGRGTEISLTIPLTLAIIDGLLVMVNGSSYVFPLADVEECFEVHSSQLADYDRNRLVNLRGYLIPYSRLRRLFEQDGAEPAIQHMVITRIGQDRVGFVVDHIVGKHQTVIKTITDLYRRNRYIAGGTILGDGTVSLILDVKELTDAAGRMEMAIAGK